MLAHHNHSWLTPTQSSGQYSTVQYSTVQYSTLLTPTQSSGQQYRLQAEENMVRDELRACGESFATPMLNAEDGLHFVMFVC